MKIVSALIMIIGLGIGFMFLISAKSAPQEAISLVPIIGAYVLGRALENFVNNDEEIVALLRKLIKDKPVEESTKSSKKKEGVLDYDQEEYFKFKSKIKKGELIICQKDSKELSIITADEYKLQKELHITENYKVLWRS